jgi:hypothetical protein
LSIDAGPCTQHPDLFSSFSYSGGGEVEGFGMIRPKFGWRQFTDLVSQRLKSEDDVKAQFVEWEASLHSRLEIGAAEYGDSSYHRGFVDLLDELLQENLDRAGWAYIMWVKANALLQQGGIKADEIVCLKHICDMSISTAHRAFGAYMQDCSSYGISATICDFSDS